VSGPLARGTRIESFPLFEISSNPTIRLSDVKNRLWSRTCPVCSARVPDLAVHALHMDDPDHVALYVHES
jgi:hypothetical protein